MPKAAEPDKMLRRRFRYNLRLSYLQGGGADIFLDSTMPTAHASDDTPSVLVRQAISLFDHYYTSLDTHSAWL